ncbi:hypothetical protein [uncultured Oscillibacter sp.]|uniref:hypothetical protein n=1 Tax=uncultured Oscillibacter sp. TaxID=876091 RepID=UPI0025E81A28|nr:hypothetical protein [uncultured Oscillibacter sp.]
MSGFDRFFLMNADDAARYAAEVLHLFEPGEDLRCREIGDGNINYVFRITSETSGRSVIIKQADKLLRSSGRPLDVRRSKIEARALQLEGALAPGLVPEIYHCDETMAVISMEDISDYRNLRSELAENRIYPHLAEQISFFCKHAFALHRPRAGPTGEKRTDLLFYQSRAVRNHRGFGADRTV